MRCVDCKFHKAFPTTNIHWCEATKKHRRISDEDAYVDAPCKVADRKTEPQTERSACDTCQWYNSGIPCGVEPSVCKREVKDEQTDCQWK